MTVKQLIGILERVQDKNKRVNLKVLSFRQDESADYYILFKVKEIQAYVTLETA